MKITLYRYNYKNLKDVQNKKKNVSDVDIIDGSVEIEITHYNYIVFLVIKNGDDIFAIELLSLANALAALQPSIIKYFYETFKFKTNDTYPF